MKEKSVTFCFFKLKAKRKGKSKFLQNHRGGGWLFCRELRSLLLNLIFTHSGLDLGLMILGNEELLRLFAWVFIDSVIRGFES